MFPISSTTLSGPNPANFPLVSPTAQTAAVDAVSSSTITPVGSALDAPAQASVQVDLSPVANFLLTVSQSREQITQLQAAVANGADPQEATARAGTLNDATQNVVDAFNLLPGVDFNQTQPQGPSLLNSLVDSLNRQTFGAAAQPLNQASQANQVGQPTSAAQSLAQSLSRIGVTLQPALLSDATAGLSLDNEILRASFNSDNQSTTNTLQNTLDTFSELATRFAEQLSAAGTGALPALASAQQDALTPEDLVANARLDMARAELDLLRQIPLPDTAADRLAAQRAELEQPLTPRATAPDSPIVNPLQASTAEVIAAQNAEAREAGINALPSQQTQSAQSLQAAGQAEQNQAANAAEENQAVANANADADTERGVAQAAADAARATAAAQAARQQAASGLSAATAASTQAAAQANIAQRAAAAATATNSANATAEQQAVAAQNAATNLAAANAAAASALAQAQAAQSAADVLAAQSAEASAAAAQARAALAAATTPEAANAAGAIAAQQAAAAQTTASNLASANAAAAEAQQQARAAQVAAVQASTMQTNPLQGNPALAAAIAAYNIDAALLGANARAVQSTVSGTPRVTAVTGPARTRGIGPGQ